MNINDLICKNGFRVLNFQNFLNISKNQLFSSLAELRMDGWWPYLVFQSTKVQIFEFRISDFDSAFGLRKNF